MRSGILLFSKGILEFLESLLLQEVLKVTVLRRLKSADAYL